MQSEYNINGRVYRLVEEEKKHERRLFTLKGGLCGVAFKRGHEKLNVGEVVNAIEIREGEVIVSRWDLLSILRLVMF